MNILAILLFFAVSAHADMWEDFKNPPPSLTCPADEDLLLFGSCLGNEEDCAEVSEVYHASVYHDSPDGYSDWEEICWNDGRGNGWCEDRPVFPPRFTVRGGINGPLHARPIVREDEVYDYHGGPRLGPNRHYVFVDSAPVRLPRDKYICHEEPREYVCELRELVRLREELQRR